MQSRSGDEPSSVLPSASLSAQAAQIVCDHVREVRKFQKICTGLSDFSPLPSDVFIVSWMKSGTTLMQQMVYQLLVASGRVPSDPSGEDFGDISEVVPFVDARHSTGVHQSQHAYSPRAWKSHSPVDELFFGKSDVGSFIYCVRDGLQVAPSYLDFALDWLSDKRIEGAQLREEVYRQFFLGHFLGLRRLESGSYEKRGDALYDWFGHVKGWMEAKREKILFLVFEDVITDLPRAVRMVAGLLDIAVDENVVRQVAAKCSRRVMAGDKRFNDNLINRIMGWDGDGGVRVRSSDAPGFKHVALPSELLTKYDEMFYDAFGVRTYVELVQKLQAKNTALLKGSG